MTVSTPLVFRLAIADRMADSQRVLASDWHDELKRVVPVADAEIFPGDQMLGQIPALIEELAGFLKTPADAAIEANAVVTTRATELGRLRHAQRASVHQVLREHQVLRRVLITFIKEQSLELRPTLDEFVDVLERLETAIDTLLQTTLDTFVAECNDTLTNYTDRLEGFNRMVTHELRQPLGIFQLAIALLRSEQIWTDRIKRDHLLEMAERNVTRLNETLATQVALSRAGDGDESTFVQRVELSAMTGGIIKQLREMADARGVRLRVENPLPPITVDAARLELVLVNLISNAIKYCDPEKPERFVEIASPLSTRPGWCTVSVRDNGLGIDDHELNSVFRRFFRSHPERDLGAGTTGLGLGLSIVADCVNALKGDIRVESAIGVGTTFELELPIMAGA